MRSRASLARVAAWLLALATLLAAGLLIAQCVRIHEAGAFSREIVRARLGKIAWAGMLWLALLVAACLLRGADGKAKSPAPSQAQRHDMGAEKARGDKAGARKALRVVLLACAVGLLALGAANGGMRDVLVKAINICTECIGLG